MTPWLWAVAAVLIAVVFAMPGDDEEPDDDVDDQGDDTGEAGPLTVPNNQGPPPEPIAEGKRKDPEIAALLIELDDYLASQGVDVSIASAREATLLPRTWTHAIPPREYWPGIAQTLREIFVPIRRALGRPVSFKAYRPPYYNDLVKGKKYIPGEKRGSAHMYFQAADLTTADPRAMALAAVRIFEERGRELRMGLGIYGHPIPRFIHVDSGFRRRTWKDTSKYRRTA